jgi:hypothetical protein
MMASNKSTAITVKDTVVTIASVNSEDYISLTDIAKYKDAENPTQTISLWMRTYNTIEFIGLWEILNNPDFKPHIYEGFKIESAKPSFWLSKQNRNHAAARDIHLPSFRCGNLSDL